MFIGIRIKIAGIINNGNTHFPRPYSCLHLWLADRPQMKVFCCGYIFFIQFYICWLPFRASFGNKAPSHCTDLGETNTERRFVPGILNKVRCIDIVALEIIDAKLPIRIVTNNADNPAFCT